MSAAANARAFSIRGACGQFQINERDAARQLLKVELVHALRGIDTLPTGRYSP